MYQQTVRVPRCIARTTHANTHMNRTRTKPARTARTLACAFHAPHARARSCHVHFLRPESCGPNYWSLKLSPRPALNVCLQMFVSQLEFGCTLRSWVIYLKCSFRDLTSAPECNQQVFGMVCRDRMNSLNQSSSFQRSSVQLFCYGHPHLIGSRAWNLKAWMVIKNWSWNLKFESLNAQSLIFKKPISPRHGPRSINGK